MAVTSIKPIKGRVDIILRYTRNPEKTTADVLAELSELHTIGKVVEYAANDMKTEKRMYVKGINCCEETAAEQFMQTKRLFDKLGGRTAFHAYQSFAEGEVTAEQAHQIGIELARKMWGERFEVLVATHLNTNHYHNHFVINSVSFADGLKFDNSKNDYAKMKKISDELCRQYGLSVVKGKGRGKHYTEWQAERNGEPTLRSQICADIDSAIAVSATERQFLQSLKTMGYELKFTGASGAELKYPALKPRGAKGYFRFHKLAAGYDYDSLLKRIYCNVRTYPFPEEMSGRTYRVRGTFTPYKKQTGFTALYFYYCYKLKIIRKHPESQRGVHFYMREDITKLDKLNEETKFLARTAIDTIPQLNEYKASIERQIDSLTAERDDMRKQSRKGNESAHGRALEISEELKKLRKELSLCQRIEERSLRIKTVIKDRTNEKEEQQNEHFGRSGGSGRENDAQRR